MTEAEQLPFQAEYAKSSRSSCKKCKSAIEKESLRLAVMMPTPAYDTKQPAWYHFTCFWERPSDKPTKAAQMEGLDQLSDADKTKIKEHIAKVVAEGAPMDEDGTLRDYSAEYAKSNRSKCCGCSEKIEKDDIRVAIKDYISKQAMMYGARDCWHHVDCFVKKRESLRVPEDLKPEKMKGFPSLKEADRDMLLSKLGSVKKAKKRESDAVSDGDAKKAKKESKEEKA